MGSGGSGLSGLSGKLLCRKLYDLFLIKFLNSCNEFSRPVRGAEGEPCSYLTHHQGHKSVQHWAILYFTLYMNREEGGR